MRRVWLTFMFILTPVLAGAQQDPVVGNWRGMLKSVAGQETPIVVTIAKAGDRYVGSTTGLAESGDVAFRKVEASGATVTVEAAADSRLGNVGLTATLMAQGSALQGDGTLAVGSQKFPVSLTLQRRVRADVVQHQVEQNAGYFVGRWKFDYVGGEFPPLSAGNRQGAVTFARVGESSFVTGTLQGESYGTPFSAALSAARDGDVGRATTDAVVRGTLLCLLVNVVVDVAWYLA